MRAVTASLKFLKASSRAPLYTASIGGADAKLDLEGEFEERPIEIRNGRDHLTSGGSFSLDREGFALTESPSGVTDFYEPSQIRDIYEKELEHLLREVTGAEKVIVFDHTRRSDSPTIRENHQTREPASVVHNDYTDRSGRKRLHTMFPDEAKKISTARFAIVNVWRPVNHLAITTPLALCDGSTIDVSNLVPTERRARDRTGELMLVSYDPGQQWYFFPGVRPDEVILLKTFDSAEDGRTSFSVHTAFEDPTAPSDAPPRESIESRCFVLFA